MTGTRQFRRAGEEIIVAFQFLTCIPMPRIQYQSDALSRAIKFFPLVGLVIGFGAVLLENGLSTHLTRPVIALLVLAYLVLITGDLHEDGLADAADGFGGGRSKERILAILKDSRIGSFGATALVLSLLARYLLLASLPLEHFAAYLISAHVLVPLDFLAAELLSRSSSRAAGPGCAHRQADVLCPPCCSEPHSALRWPPSRCGGPPLNRCWPLRSLLHSPAGFIPKRSAVLPAIALEQRINLPRSLSYFVEYGTDECNLLYPARRNRYGWNILRPLRSRVEPSWLRRNFPRSSRSFAHATSARFTPAIFAAPGPQPMPSPAHLILYAASTPVFERSTLANGKVLPGTRSSVAMQRMLVAG